MVMDLERRVNELRFLYGIEKVEHVTFQDRDEFWVRFTHPLDLQRLTRVANAYHYEVVKFGSFPSKLPSKLDGLLWNGVSYVIVKQINFFGLLASFFGSEPEGVAKIVKDLQSSQPIFVTTSEEGIKILYDYLRINYVPPASPTPAKIVAPARPPTPLPTRPTAPGQSTPPPAAPKPTTQPQSTSQR